MKKTKKSKLYDFDKSFPKLINDASDAIFIHYDSKLDCYSFRYNDNFGIQFVIFKTSDAKSRVLYFSNTTLRVNFLRRLHCKHTSMFYDKMISKYKEYSNYVFAAQFASNGTRV